MVKYLILGLFILMGVLLSGCTQQTPVSPVQEAVSVITEIPSPEPVTPQEEMNKLSENGSADNVTDISEPMIPTLEPPLPVPTQTSNPNLAFNALVLAKLDLIQEGKTAVLDSWKTGNTTAVNALITELRHNIRNSNDASTFPKKMDYVRVNYYDFTDRMTQFTDNFAQAASLKERGENSSSNSYVSAGIMAGDSADISDKQIRVFLKDHPYLL